MGPHELHGLRERVPRAERDSERTEGLGHRLFQISRRATRPLRPQRIQGHNGSHQSQARADGREGDDAPEHRGHKAEQREQPRRTPLVAAIGIHQCCHPPFPKLSHGGPKRRDAQHMLPQRPADRPARARQPAPRSVTVAGLAARLCTGILARQQQPRAPCGENARRQRDDTGHERLHSSTSRSSRAPVRTASSTNDGSRTSRQLAAPASNATSSSSRTPPPGARETPV